MKKLFNKYDNNVNFFHFVNSQKRVTKKSQKVTEYITRVRRRYQRRSLEFVRALKKPSVAR